MRCLVIDRSVWCYAYMAMKYVDYNIAYNIIIRPFVPHTHTHTHTRNACAAEVLCVLLQFNHHARIFNVMCSRCCDRSHTSLSHHTILLPIPISQIQKPNNNRISTQSIHLIIFLFQFFSSLSLSRAHR